MYQMTKLNKEIDGPNSGIDYLVIAQCVQKEKIGECILNAYVAKLKYAILSGARSSPVFTAKSGVNYVIDEFDLFVKTAGFKAYSFALAYEYLIKEYSQQFKIAGTLGDLDMGHNLTQIVLEVYGINFNNPRWRACDFELAICKIISDEHKESKTKMQVGDYATTVDNPLTPELNVDLLRCGMQFQFLLEASISNVPNVQDKLFEQSVIVLASSQDIPTLSQTIVNVYVKKSPGFNELANIDSAVVAQTILEASKDTLSRLLTNVLTAQLTQGSIYAIPLSDILDANYTLYFTAKAAVDFPVTTFSLAF